MHSSTFEYLKPTDEQIEQMSALRKAAKAYMDVLDNVIPEHNADRTYLIRKFREVAMWANITVTRHSDGSPR